LTSATYSDILNVVYIRALDARELHAPKQTAKYFQILSKLSKMVMITAQQEALVVSSWNEMKDDAPTFALKFFLRYNFYVETVISLCQFIYWIT
jgi:hypothetical protein